MKKGPGIKPCANPNSKFSFALGNDKRKIGNSYVIALCR